MFAVVEAGSKQYHVKVGDIIKVERLGADVGSMIDLDKVLAVGSQVGHPLLEKAKVQVEVLEHKQCDKVIVFKKKRRHNYRRKNGHRQWVSVLKVKEISV